MSYEFINISYVLILRDPLIRAHMGNAGKIQSQQVLYRVQS